MRPTTKRSSALALAALCAAIALPAQGCGTVASVADGKLGVYSGLRHDARWVSRFAGSDSRRFRSLEVPLATFQSWVALEKFAPFQ